MDGSEVLKVAFEVNVILKHVGAPLLCGDRARNRRRSQQVSLKDAVRWSKDRSIISERLGLWTWSNQRDSVTHLLFRHSCGALGEERGAEKWIHTAAHTMTSCSDHHLKHLWNASQWYLHCHGNRITVDTFSGAGHECMKWFHPNDFKNKSQNRRLKKKTTYLLVLLVSVRPNLIKYFVQSIFFWLS